MVQAEVTFEELARLVKRYYPRRYFTKSKSGKTIYIFFGPKTMFFNYKYTIEMHEQNQKIILSVIDESCKWNMIDTEITDGDILATIENRLKELKMMEILDK